jgi:hypothetical protein
MKRSILLLFMVACAAMPTLNAVPAQNQVSLQVSDATSISIRLPLHPPLLVAPGSLTIVPPRPLLGEFGEHLFYEPSNEAVVFVYRFTLAGNPINKPFLSEEIQ